MQLELARRLAAGTALCMAWGISVTSADWKAPSWIATTTQDSSFPELAITSDGALHAVWHEGPFLGDTEILYSTQLPGGAWTAPISISNRPDVPSCYPDIAVTPDDSLHVVWDDGKHGDQEIYYTTLEGGLWSTPVNIAQTADQSSVFPVVEVGSSGAVYVAWQEELPQPLSEEIFFAERLSNGSFQPPVNVSMAPEDANNPQLIVDGEHLHLAWHEYDGDDYDIRYAERPAGGSWSTAIDVTDTNVWSTDVVLALGEDGTLHAAWEEGPGFGDHDVVYAQKPAGGSWSPLENISQSDFDSTDPVLLVETDGTVHVAFDDSRAFQNDVFHTQRFPDGGWSEQVNLTNTPTTSQDVAKAFRQIDGRIFLYWLALLVVDGSDVYESELDADGWSAPRRLNVRRFQGGISTASPEIAPDGSLHMLVSSAYDRDDVSDIFHLRNDGPGPTPPVNVGFSPDGGSGTVGAATTFSVSYSDANGAGSLRRTFLVLNNAPTPADGVLVVYDWTADFFALFSESGQGIVGSCSPGQQLVVSHNYVELDCSSSAVTVVGEDQLTVEWRLTFTACPPSGCGLQTAAGLALDIDGLRDGPESIGSWTLSP